MSFTYRLNILARNMPNIKPNPISEKPDRRAPTKHFVPWLKCQTWKGGPVGMIARFIKEEPQYDGLHHRDLKAHLLQRQVPQNIISALDLAYRHWKIIRMSGPYA